jgi:methyl-accepting chemotaxis protein
MLVTMLRGLNAVGFDLAHLGKNAEEGTANAQSIAQASERLFVSVFEISQSADEATEKATAADESAATGLAAVRNAVGAMEKIAGSVDETAKKLDALSHASERIDQILSLTGNIAAQTKLLALNATIEAVRAGEAGKSFAVVAGEVKRLAEESAKASEEIKSHVAGLHTGVSLIVATMAQTTKAVSEGERAVADAGATMEAMSQQVSAAAAKMKEITEVVGNQSGITAEIAQWVDKITATANEGAERLRSAAQKMKAGNSWFAETAGELPGSESPKSACGLFKLNHLMLGRQVIDALLGASSLKADEVADPADCACQQWLDENAAEFGDSALLDEVETLHEQVHALAQKVLRAHESADADAALAALSEFSEANSKMCRCVNELCREHEMPRLADG